MSFKVFLLILSSLLSLSVSAKTYCMFFVGDGQLAKPIIEERFVRDLKAVQAKWKDCDKSVSLISFGENTYRYNANTGQYLKLENVKINGEANWTNAKEVLKTFGGELGTGDNVKIYLGDHGVKGGVMGTAGFIPASRFSPLISELGKKGVGVRSIFQHCYSGPMHKMLYDLDKGEVYGCGVSLTNDDIGFTNNNNYSSLMISKPIVIKDHAIKDQTYVNEDQGLTRLNLTMTTLDRFLQDYSESLSNETQDQDCNPLPSIPIIELVNMVSSSQIEMDIQKLEIEKSKMIANFAAQNPGLDKYINEYATETNVKLEESVSKFHLAFNEEFKRWVVTDKERNKVYIDYARVFSELETWVKKKNDVRTHPHFKMYSDLSKQVNLFKLQFQTSTLTKDVPNSGLDENYQYLTIKESLDRLTRIRREMTFAKVYHERMNLFNLKLKALRAMQRKKDLKAKSMYLKLRECEQQTI